MMWYIVICGFLDNGDIQCDRGLSFEKEIDCIFHERLLENVEQVSSVYCEMEMHDVRN